MRTNKELQRENEKLRLRLKKCMVWRREVRRLNKTIEFYAYRFKEEERLAEQKLKNVMEPTIKNNFGLGWGSNIKEPFN